MPIARKPDGTPLTGPVIQRLINLPANTSTFDLTSADSRGLTYQRPLTLDTSKASLTRRTSPGATGVRIPATDWAFADCSKSPFPGTPEPLKICVKGGFDPESEYTLVFTAKDPLVLGIGYAATRDLTSFLRYADKDETGAPNPVAKQVKWALSRGSSQSGNFIRSYIHLGFNQDESGRIVWDGANPHIAARQLALNFRFAVGGGAAAMYEPGSEAVLWWSDYPDTVRGRQTASLLTRCRATKTCPKIFETFGGLEMWYLRESPNLVGTDAKADIPLPPNVRRYFFPGTTHGGGRGGFNAAAPAVPNGCVLPANPESPNRNHARPDRGPGRLGDQRVLSRRPAAIPASIKVNWRLPPRPPSDFLRSPAFRRPTVSSTRCSTTTTARISTTTISPA